MGEPAYQRYATTHLFHAERRCELCRNAIPFANIQDVEEFWDSLHRMLDGVDLAGWSLLTDLREVRGRNDAEFEATMAPRRRALHARFRRIAVVVRTAVGRIQVARHSDEEGSDVQVYDDLERARAWLGSAA